MPAYPKPCHGSSTVKLRRGGVVGVRGYVDDVVVVCVCIGVGVGVVVSGACVGVSIGVSIGVVVGVGVGSGWYWCRVYPASAIHLFAPCLPFW